MKNNKTSWRISKFYEDDTSHHFEAKCSCGGCEQELEVKAFKDKEYNYHDISLEITSDVYYSEYYRYETKLKRFWFRLRDAFRLIFKGEIKLSNSFLMDSKVQVEDYIQALTEAKEELWKSNEK